MNILILTNQGGLAGSTQSMAYLAKGLADRGYCVVIGCRSDVWLTEAVKDSQVIWREVSFQGQIDRKGIRAIRDIVLEFNIQLINSQTARAGRLAALAKWYYGLKVGLFITRRQHPHHKAKRVRGISLRLISDHVIVVSQGVKKGLRQMGVPENHLTVIENGTPASKYELSNKIQEVEKLRKKHNLNPDDFVIGCVARRKEQIQLLKALNHLKKPVTLIFIGINENPEFSLVIDAYETPHRVLFLGEVPPEQTLYYYLLFSIKVLPSVIEGLSQSLLEAMALGVPVIATNAAGNPDLIQHQKNGLLFSNDNIIELAGCIQLLRDTPDLREALSKEGRKTALETFSLSRTIDRYEHFFKTFLAQSHPMAQACKGGSLAQG